MKTLRLFVSLFVLCGATVAAASPFDVCIVGCKKEPTFKVGVGDDGKFKLEEAKVLPNLYLSPSIGFDAFIRDNASKEWKAGIIPGVGYGIKYRPSSWTLTQNVLALDVFAQAAMGADTFNIDVLPVVTIFDWVGIGFGYRFKLATTADGSDKAGTLFSIGIRKSMASF